MSNTICRLRWFTLETRRVWIFQRCCMRACVRTRTYSGYI